MSIIVRIDWGYKEQTVQAEQGELLSDILRGNGRFDLPCGGRSVCRRCKVRAEGALSPLTDIELETFSHDEIKSGLRLACLTRAEGDARLYPVQTADIAIMDKGAASDFSADPIFTEYGVAADIGTTTVCVRLYGSAGMIGSAAEKNPQTIYGADVISRIEHSLGGGGEELALAVRNGLSEMTARLAKEAGINTSRIDAAVLAGNTTMLYLLAGNSPKALSRAPFAADRLFGEYINAADLIHGLNERAFAYLPRCMSAFVGADISMALLASGMCGRPETALLTDVGTNAEIALWHKGKLYVCSTAAGPAFEGSGLSCGVYGISGAVDHIWLENGKVKFSTINNKPPVGICGSGIADALSVMVKSEAIDETGAFGSGDGFFINENVYVNQKDVRKLQLSKAAVRAGMETLLQIAGVKWLDVSALNIAGGFGSFLDLNSAADIGLIPREMLPRTTVLGNASLAGASMLLQDRQLIEKSQMLAQRAETVRLDSNPVFSDFYVDWMMFEV